MPTHLQNLLVCSVSLYSNQWPPLRLPYLIDDRQTTSCFYGNQQPLWDCCIWPMTDRLPSAFTTINNSFWACHIQLTMDRLLATFTAISDSLWGCHIQLTITALGGPLLHHCISLIWLLTDRPSYSIGELPSSTAIFLFPVSNVHPCCHGK